jgi:hypothetical protein
MKSTQQCEIRYLTQKVQILRTNAYVIMCCFRNPQHATPFAHPHWDDAKHAQYVPGDATGVVDQGPATSNTGSVTPGDAYSKGAALVFCSLK